MYDNTEEEGAAGETTVVQFAGLNEDNARLAMRLSVAMAYAQVLQFAYDALLTHGIDYQKLPEYKQMDALLQTANEREIDRSRTIILDWISDLETGIRAAIRRKSMRLV